jgi:hypothetical protein
VARGKWNPLVATGTPVESVRALCDDAVLGVSLALADVEFSDDRLVHRLLTGELRRAVSRTFTRAGYPGGMEDPNPRKTRHGQQEPINFGDQSGVQAGGPGDAPAPGRRGRRSGDGGSTCICCCDGCECCCCDEACCECGDCCDCS